MAQRKSTSKSNNRKAHDPISRADEILLIVLLVLEEEAYSTSILAEVLNRAGKKITVGSLWVSLDQLTEKGLVEKNAFQSTERKGGRPRIYYRLTPAGKTELKSAQTFQKELWKGVPDID